VRHAKFGVLAAVLAGAALLALGPALAVADGKRDRPLKLRAVVKQVTYLDLDDPGPSLGDQYVFSEVLRKHGRRVGESGVHCTVVKIAPPYGGTQTRQCVATLRLRRGQITVQGLNEVQSLDDPGPFTFAITGGTGAYSGASGKLVARAVRPGRAVLKLFIDKKRRH